MTPTAERQELIHEIALMSDTEVSELLARIRYIKRMNAFELPPDYNPNNDPAIGFMDGSPDLAEQVEEILYSELSEPRKD